MSEDAGKPVARPQRTTRSERRRASRRPESAADPTSGAAAGAADEGDEVSSFDTLVDVEVSSADDAEEKGAGRSQAAGTETPSDASGKPSAAVAAAGADAASGAPTDSFEALDDDDGRPTREMHVVPLELSEDDKTMPRIRVDELAARMQGARPEAPERVEPPATPSRPVVEREDEAPADEPTHPRVVVKMTSVVIAPSRIIGVEGSDDDVAPRMASRPPPPSTPVATASAPIAFAPSLPRPPVVERERAEMHQEALAAEPSVATAEEGDRVSTEPEGEAEADEHIVDVDVAEIESAGQVRTPPPPPPAPEAKGRTSVVPKRPPPPPVAPNAIPTVVTAVAPPAPPAPPVPPVPPPPAVAVAGTQAPITASQPVAPPRVEDEQKKRKQARQWWERFFSEDYLRAVQPPTPAQIAPQVDFMVESLGLERGATILDVGCGLGLHCVELTRRGFLTVGLDLSLAMITRAAEAAQRQSLKINFLHADIREMQFDGAFDAAICMGTTFGFFDDESNRDVLARLHQALRPGGRLLLDVANRDYVMPMQPNLVWFEGDGCVCMEESDFNHFTSRLSVKRTMMREDGTQSSSEYSLRLYSLHELGLLVQQMGFRVLEVSGQEAVRGAFFGACAPRIMLLAERRSPGRMSQVMPPERGSTEVPRPVTVTQERASAEIPKPPPKPPGTSGSSGPSNT